MKKYSLSENYGRARAELEERFPESAQNHSSSSVEVGIFLMKNVHDTSVDVMKEKILFTRTRNAWDARKVERLFRDQENTDGKITTEAFVAVGMQFFFEEIGEREIE